MLLLCISTTNLSQLWEHQLQCQLMDVVAEQEAGNVKWKYWALRHFIQPMQNLICNLIGLYGTCICESRAVMLPSKSVIRGCRALTLVWSAALARAITACPADV